MTEGQFGSNETEQALRKKNSESTYRVQGHSRIMTSNLLNACLSTVMISKYSLLVEFALFGNVAMPLLLFSSTTSMSTLLTGDQQITAISRDCFQKTIEIVYTDRDYNIQVYNTKMHFSFLHYYPLLVQRQHFSQNDIGNGVPQLDVFPPFKKYVHPDQTAITNIE